MKKHVLAFILTGIMILSLSGCAKRETVDFDNIMDIKTEGSQEKESVEDFHSITNIETESVEENEERITEPEASNGSTTDYSGQYTDKQGTAEAYSELELNLQNDGTYTFTMSIYRVTTLEGIAVYENGALHFVCDEPHVEGTIVISGSEAQVTITDSSFSEIQAGETYSFLL